MIRVVMLGRTGNNLFQYALGRVLSKMHNVPLVMDGSWFNRHHWMGVSCLNRLPLKMQIQRGWSLGSRMLKHLVGKHPWELVGLPILRDTDGMVPFDRKYINGPSECVIMGYFQSWLYFQDIESELREDLQMDKLSWGDATKREATCLRSGNSVAVHVRRTDYIGSKTFDVCGSDYYTNAMNILRQRHENLRFYVFSDDPSWCERKFADNDTDICSVPDAINDPLHDLYLMSCARHHIIANSSYSWWAAWIANHSNQNVLAPSRWLGGGKAPPIDEKIYPGWEIVEVDHLSNK